MPTFYTMSFDGDGSHFETFPLINMEVALTTFAMFMNILKSEAYNLAPSFIDS